MRIETILHLIYHALIFFSLPLLVQYFHFLKKNLMLVFCAFFISWSTFYRVVFFSLYSFLKIKLNLAMLNVFLFLVSVSSIIFFFILFGKLICSNTLQKFLNNLILNVRFFFIYAFQNIFYFVMSSSLIWQAIWVLVFLNIWKISVHFKYIFIIYLYISLFLSTMISAHFQSFEIYWNFFPNI